MTTVVMVHGNPDTHQLWDLVIDALGDIDDDILAVDLPGFAEPAPVDWRATKEEYVQWLLGQINRVAQDSGPVHLVAHDWWAMLALRAASLRPDLVRSIAAGGGPIDEHYIHHAAWKTMGEPGLGEQWAEQVSAEQVASAIEAMGVPKRFAAMNCISTPGAASCLLRLYRSATDIGAEWGPDLARITSSALIIWGDYDLAAPIETGRRMATRIGADFLALPTDHFWPYEAPEQVAGALRHLWGRSVRRVVEAVPASDAARGSDA
jgi:pimeloyl-ACP methyl ester carboxylesterase